MDADVLIVGGGIGGAALALSLGQRGRSVTIVERDASPPRLTRPEVLAESTFAAFDRLQIGDRLRSAASVALDGFEVRRGERVLATISQADLRAAGAAPRSVDPVLIRAFVMEAAIATGNVHMLRGADVKALVYEDGRAAGVRGEAQGIAFELRARLVVGDDGARSMVRQALNIPIVLRPFPVEFLTARFRRPIELPDNQARIWIGAARVGRGLRVAGFLPVPGGESLAVLPIAAGESDSLTISPDEFWRDLADVTPITPALRDVLAFPDDFSRFRLAFGHTTRYVARGGVLVGDAAHPMSPAGGQGANAAIADGLALAEIVDAGLRAGDLSDTHLITFDRRRRPANARSLAFSERGARIVHWSRWVPGTSWLVTSALRIVGSQDGLKRRLLHQVATAFLERPSI